MIEFEEIKEKVILVGVSLNDGDDTQDSLTELEELASTAGAQTVGVLIQTRTQIPVSYTHLDVYKRQGQRK